MPVMNSSDYKGTRGERGRTRGQGRERGERKGVRPLP